MSVDEAHTLSGEFKKALMEQETELADVIIHIEPFEPSVDG